MNNNTSGSAIDKRHFTRIPFQANAVIFSPQHKLSWPCALLDISLKGLKISRPENWQVAEHDHVIVDLKLDPSDINIKIQAEVIHIGESFIGMMNSYIDVDSATHLHRLVELNLGDSNMLKREYSELIALKD